MAKKRLATVVAMISGIVVLASAFLALGCRAESQDTSSDEASRLVGDWTGESICTGNNPSCHDEKVVYHITKSPDKANTFVISADKIVDGKLENMSVLDFKYDASKHLLTGEYQNPRYHLIIELTIKGDVIEGVMLILPERTVGRRIKVIKDK